LPSLPIAMLVAFVFALLLGVPIAFVLALAR
jgi:hypothetical protein